MLLPFAFPHEPVTLTFILKLCWVYITAVAMKLICSFLTSLYTISSEHEKLKNHPLKGVYQMIKLIVICVGVIIIVSTLIDKDPVNILTGLGASAAILMLVFKDTIMGLVAGVQLSANDMLRPGDWITMPKYGADGTVIEVTLTTVKVRNWDTELILMVRQLQPTPQGLPIELYFFSANKDWIPYERLQAEVFDHLLAVLPEFGLRVFQSPSGLDVLSLSSH